MKKQETWFAFELTGDTKEDRILIPATTRGAAFREAKRIVRETFPNGDVRVHYSTQDVEDLPLLDDNSRLLPRTAKKKRGSDATSQR